MAAIFNFLFCLFGGGCILGYKLDDRKRNRKTKYQVKRNKGKKRKR